MNIVARQLETVVVAAPPARALGEMEAFAALDPLLADLNKQYLDARENRVQVLKDFGADEPMSEMALLVEDSAWCAVQTRYMELRAQREMMAQAQAMMQQARMEEELEVKAQKEREADEQYKQLQFVAQMTERKKGTDASGLWLALYVLFFMDQQSFRSYHASHQFNRLAA